MNHQIDILECCDAKFCLFDITQMNPKDLDLQLFDIWCVDDNNSIEIEASNPTESPREETAPTSTYNNEVEGIKDGEENMEKENNVIIETYDTDIEDNALLIRGNISSVKRIHYSLISLEVLVAIGLVSVIGYKIRYIQY